MNIEGSIRLIGSKHTVEHYTEDQLGGGTLFLKVTGSSKVVPIYKDQIEDVIEMLRTGKELLTVLEQEKKYT